eukprot:5445446-Amphidinium_carterae.2
MTSNACDSAMWWGIGCFFHLRVWSAEKPSYDENLLTCRFLESARKIVTKPLLNEFSSDDLKTKLEDEVVRIQRQLGNLEGWKGQIQKGIKATSQ